MSDSGWFAPLDDEDRQHLISSFLSVGVSITASAVGMPWLMFATAPLDILVKKAYQMWTGANNRPVRAFAVGGQQALVKYQGLCIVPLLSVISCRWVTSRRVV